MYFSLEKSVERGRLFFGERSYVLLLRLSGGTGSYTCPYITQPDNTQSRSAFQREATIYRRVNNIIFQSERSVSKQWYREN